MATTGRYVLRGRKGLFYLHDGVDADNRTGYTGIQLVGYDAYGNPQLTFGTSSSPVSVTAAGNTAQFYVTSSSTSGDNRAVYSKLTLTGVGGNGEAGRFYALANAAVGTLHGVHVTAQVNAGTGVTGEAAGARATLATTTGLTLSGGTYAALRLDSDLSSSLGGATDVSWIYVADLNGTNKITNFLNLAAVDTAAMYIAAGTSAGSAGKSDGCAAQQVLKCKINGATVYIPVFTQNT